MEISTCSYDICWNYNFQCFSGWELLYECCMAGFIGWNTQIGVSGFCVENQLSGGGKWKWYSLLDIWRYSVAAGYVYSRVESVYKKQPNKNLYHYRNGHYWVSKIQLVLVYKWQKVFLNGFENYGVQRVYYTNIQITLYQFQGQNYQFSRSTIKQWINSQWSYKIYF
uniref:Uncharacterized protein n=1 Tax=Spironucleus salmonicida TaxID=348837 RepID=V6M0K5_9EUKA|eukprot:EST49581.1 Hypothetical protein SS50377_10084 [Spironucleus salmonicida]